MMDTIEPGPALMEEHQGADDLVRAGSALGVGLIRPNGLLTGPTRSVLGTGFTEL